jgi:hypothetical protein
MVNFVSLLWQHLNYVGHDARITVVYRFIIKLPTSKPIPFRVRVPAYIHILYTQQELNSSIWSDEVVLQLAISNQVQTKQYQRDASKSSLTQAFSAVKVLCLRRSRHPSPPPFLLPINRNKNCRLLGTLHPHSLSPLSLVAVSNGSRCETTLALSAQPRFSRSTKCFQSLHASMP